MPNPVRPKSAEVSVILETGMPERAMPFTSRGNDGSPVNTPILEVYILEAERLSVKTRSLTNILLV